MDVFVVFFLLGSLDFEVGGVEGGGQGKGAVQRPSRVIDLSVRSLPVRCVQLVEDQVGFPVVQFSSCSLNSAFFLVLPGQPTAWVCVQRSLLQVSRFC